MKPFGQKASIPNQTINTFLARMKPKEPPLKQIEVQSMKVSTRSTADNLLETLEILSETARVHAKHTQGSGSLDSKFVRNVKELSNAWAVLHAEIRTTIQSMSDEDYLKLLSTIQEARQESSGNSIDSTLAPTAPLPSPIHSGALPTFNAPTNFQESQTEVSHTHTLTPEQLSSNKAPGFTIIKKKKLDFNELELKAKTESEPNS